MFTIIATYEDLIAALDHAARLRKLGKDATVERFFNDITCDVKWDVIVLN